MDVSRPISKHQKVEHFQNEMKCRMTERMNPITEIYCKWAEREKEQDWGVRKRESDERVPQSGTLHQSSIVRFA
jgi:hypothetical protein